MSVYRDKTTGGLIFDFDRYIEGQRIRARRRLPRAWSRATADAYDRKESARLYASARGVSTQQDHGIEDAVAYYLTHRLPQLKHARNVATELALLYPYYRGRSMRDLAEVSREILNMPVKISEKRKNLAPATIKNRIRYLTAACRYAWKYGGMGDSDPAARVVVPTVRNESRVYLDRRQMLILARLVQQRQVRAAIRIAFYSGMRFSEIERAQVVGNAFVLDDSKNSDSRIIPIHVKIRSAALVPRAPYHVVRYHVAKARDAMGLPKVTFHKLRHSAASAMLNRGVQLRTIGMVLGHRSIQSTNRYSHLEVEQARLALGKIGSKVA